MSNDGPNDEEWNAALDAFEEGLGALGLPAPVKAAKDVVALVRRHTTSQGALEREYRRLDSHHAKTELRSLIEQVVEDAIEPLAGAALEQGDSLERVVELLHEVLAKVIPARASGFRETIDFTLERDRHACFLGREEILTELDAYLAERESGWLVVTGGPGLGKSALLSQWLSRREKAGQPTAFHFIRRGHKNWAEPGVVRANLAAQIEQLFPEQRDGLADPMYQLEQLLTRVSAVLGERDKQLVLLVDGLDEAMMTGQANPVPRMFPVEIPKRVIVVVSSRPRYPHLNWFTVRTGYHRLDLDARVESNTATVRAFWGTLGAMMSPPLSAELVECAIERANGNLLHAVKLHELWSKPEALRSVEEVPEGFEGMILELWHRLEELDEVRLARVEDGLALLCTARESLPPEAIDELLEWRDGWAERYFLPVAREMLLEERWHGRPTYRPFHEGFREFVIDRRGRTVKRLEATLAGFAAWPLEGDDFRCSYALRYRVGHQIAAGNVDAAAQTCTDLEYLTAKACSEGVLEVERDLRLAAQAQTDRETWRKLTMLERAVVASAHWAGLYPEALPKLVYDRLLTADERTCRELLWPASHPHAFPRLRQPLQGVGLSRILGGHQASVSTVAVLSDGRVVSGHADGTLRVWDPDTGKALATTKLHADAVTLLAALPDRRVVSGSGDCALCVWDSDTGKVLVTMQGDLNSASALTVLPDCRVVSASLDGTLQVWDPDSGQALAVLEGHQHEVTAIVMSPDGRVVSAAQDGTLRVWDIDSGRALTVHQDSIRAMAALPGHHIVAVSLDGTVRVWDLDSGRALTTFQTFQDAVFALAVLPSGYIVSGSMDSTLKVWDPDSGEAIATLQGHDGSVFDVAALPDGRFVSASEDGTVRVWDLDSDQPWDLDCDHSLCTFHGHQGWVIAVRILPDGRIVSGSEDGTLRVWDPDVGGGSATRMGHAEAILDLAVLPEGQVVTASKDRTMWVWDPGCGAVAPNMGNNEPICAVAALPDGRFVSASENGTLRVWEWVEFGEETAILEHDQGSARAVVVLPDGRIVSASDNELLVWDPAAGRVLVTLRGHHDSVCSVVVLPDGRIVSGSKDATLRVWDPDSGQELMILQNYQDPVRAMSVFPDGRVVSLSGATTLRVWDPDSGQLLETVRGEQGEATDVAVLFDGRIVFACTDGTLQVWDMESREVAPKVFGDAAFMCVAAVEEGLMAAGDSVGNLWFIDIGPASEIDY